MTIVLEDIHGIIYSGEIDQETLNKDEFDYEFGQDLMVKFQNREGGYFAINAVDGWGYNRAADISGQQAVII